MFEDLVRSREDAARRPDFDLRSASVEDLARFTRQEKLLTSFHHRFDRLEQELAFHQPIDDENLAALHRICVDRDFDFLAASRFDCRTPLGRLLTLTTEDPVLNFGFSRIPWLIQDRAIAVIAAACVRRFVGEISAQESFAQINRSLDWMLTQELSPVAAVAYGAAANRIAVELLQKAVGRIQDLNQALLDPKHRYLDRIFNTEVIDLFISHGLVALQGGYDYGRNGPFASPAGLKFVARLMIADEVLPGLSGPERELTEAALVRQIKPLMMECLARGEFFKLQNGSEPADPVATIFFEYMCTLSDDAMLELMAAAGQGGYFSGCRFDAELPDLVCEGFYPIVNLEFLGDCPYPVKTFRFLVSQGLPFDEDSLAFLKDADRELEQALAADVGPARAFLLDQRARVGEMAHLVQRSCARR